MSRIRTRVRLDFGFSVHTVEVDVFASFADSVDLGDPDQVTAAVAGNHSILLGLVGGALRDHSIDPAECIVDLLDAHPVPHDVLPQRPAAHTPVLPDPRPAPTREATSETTSETAAGAAHCGASNVTSGVTSGVTSALAVCPASWTITDVQVRETTTYTVPVTHPVGARVAEIATVGEHLYAQALHPDAVFAHAVGPDEVTVTGHPGDPFDDPRHAPSHGHGPELNVEHGAASGWLLSVQDVSWWAPPGGDRAGCDLEVVQQGAS